MRRTLSALALLLAASMLFFTFFAWGWFSDIDGFKAYFEIPVTTESGSLATFADVIWMLAPFFLLAAAAMSFAAQKKILRTLSLFFASIPLAVYALCQVLLFLGEKEGHFSILITLFFLLILAALTVASAFFPELHRFAGQLALIHVAVEVLLVVLSAVFGEKYSQFYFSQLLPFGHYSNFRYSFFLISIFCYYISFSLCLCCLHFSIGKAAFPTPSSSIASSDAQNDEEEAEPDTDPEAEEETSLSLEDLGIER